MTTPHEGFSLTYGPIDHMTITLDLEDHYWTAVFRHSHSSRSGAVCMPAIYSGLGVGELLDVIDAELWDAGGVGGMKSVVVELDEEPIGSSSEDDVSE